MTTTKNEHLLSYGENKTELKCTSVSEIELSLSCKACSSATGILKIIFGLNIIDLLERFKEHCC